MDKNKLKQSKLAPETKKKEEEKQKKKNMIIRWIEFGTCHDRLIV